MRLPRRIPWASLAELDHVCSCIYTDENDIDAKVLAINRISAWKAITALPHALESTLALLVVIVQDRTQPHLSASTLVLRQSYAIAVIRLVNGLVDPLQVGTYARSISAIAAQLGLPSWLVELRHAATHEELPSLDLLREASRQSMSWLLYNYFLPTLNPASSSSSSSHLAAAASVRPLAPVLKVYKNTMKTITRDVSLAKAHKPRLVALMRDLERWIAECKVAANAAHIVSGDVDDWTDANASAGGDAKEIWALERFVDVLAERGMLVPVSKKKRAPSKDGTLPNTASTAIWAPLLHHVRAMHAAAFPAVLCRQFIAVLLRAHAGNDDDGSPQLKEGSSEDPQLKGELEDPTYYGAIARWVAWAVQTWGGGDKSNGDLKKDVVAQLLAGLGCAPSPSPRTTKSSAYTLLKDLVSGQEELEVMTALFAGQQLASPKKAWSGEQDLDVMAQRHALLMQTLSSATATESTPTKTPEPQQQRQQQQNSSSPTILAPGWRKVDASWKPCPIGVYVR